MPIARMILQRIGLGCLTLLLVSAVIFFSVELLPGDLAEEILGQDATPETVAALRLQLGLTQPAPVRYLAWLGGMLRGELGMSLANRLPITDILAGRLGNTLFLAAFAALLAVPAAIGGGLVAAMFRNRALDRTLSMSSLAVVSLPEFMLGYLLIYGFAGSGLFPAISYVTETTGFLERIHLTFLPALSLALAISAHMLRMTRASVINVLAAPYIEMARLKGLSNRIVIGRHAFPNAIAPIANVVALTLAYLITGVVVIEVVFAYPGLGKLMVDSVSKRDIPVVQAVGLMFAAIFIVANLLADIVATLSNPRLLHRTAAG